MELTALVRRVLPALGDLSFPDEPLATCSACVMAPRPHVREGDVVFTAPARCCTYHPTLANHLVGQALARGGLGADRLRARMADPDGVTALGIAPGRTRAQIWRSRGDDDYGRSEALTCPYWVDQALGCAIHADRDAVCRTWFCRVAKGARGQAAWVALKGVLAEVEHSLARHCVEHGDPPGSGPFEDWFRWCASHVAGMTDETLRAMGTPRLLALEAQARAAVARRDAPMPDVLQPRITDWVVRPDEVALASFSPFDRTVLPPWIFGLLSKLDGERPWREALDLASDELGRDIPAEWVLWCWERGLVGPAVEVGGSAEPVVSVIPGD